MNLLKTTQVAMMSAALMAGAGAGAVHGAAAPSSPLILSPPRNFDLRGVALMPDGEGVRARGSLCRTAGVGPWPSRIRLALLSASGDVVSAAVSPIGPVSARKTGCVVYTVQAPWRPDASQTVRLSATRL